MRLSTFVSLLALLIAFPLTAFAQSGRATFKGYVAFEDVAYVDKQPVATVELFRADDAKREHALVTTHTDEHGHYEIAGGALGELVLRIAAPGFATYEIPIYLPSDFSGNLATMMKKIPAATQKQ